MHTWEEVHKSAGGFDVTERMEVPGGWIYRNVVLCDYNSDVSNYAPTMVFVPNREWKP